MKHSARYNKQYNEGVKRCTTPFNSSKLYAFFQSIGLCYGPKFQKLCNIRLKADGSDACGTIKDAGSIFMQPSTIDAIFQLILPPISKGCQQRIPTTVPTRLPHLWIDNFATAETGRDFNVHVNATHKGLRTADSCIIGIDSGSKTPVIIGSLQVTSVADCFPLGGDRGYSVRPVCYTIQSMPDIELLEKEYLHNLNRKKAIKLLNHPDTDDQKSQLCYSVISRLQDKISKGSIRTGPSVQIQKYLDWMCYVLKVKEVCETTPKTVVRHLVNLSSPSSLLM